MNNKKGISAIVATVLIILITVAAVTIIWAAIIPMITKGLGETDCFGGPEVALTIVGDYTCYNATAGGFCNNTAAACQTKAACETPATCGVGATWFSGMMNVQVHKDSGDSKVIGVDIIAGKDGTTTATRFLDVPTANGEKVYQVNYTQLGVARPPQEISLAAVIKSGNTQKACGAGMAVQVVNCA